MLRIILILLGVLCVAPAALADPAADYRKGRNAYLYGDFKKTIQLLDPLVGSDPAKLVDPKEVALALEMLGLSRYYLGEEEAAKQVFERLILFDLDRSLNPITAPPEAVALYDALKGELKTEIEIRRRAIEEARQRRERENMVREVISNRQNSRVIAVLPFGIGQFQNGDDLVGGLFLGTELVAIALSVSFFLAAEDLRNANGRFERADIADAQNFQTAQLVSGGVAAALMVGGAVHALLNFQEQVELDRDIIKPGKPQVTITPVGAGILIPF